MITPFAFDARASKWTGSPSAQCFIAPPAFACDVVSTGASIRPLEAAVAPVAPLPVLPVVEVVVEPPESSSLPQAARKAALVRRAPDAARALRLHLPRRATSRL